MVGYPPIFTYGQLIFVKIWNLFYLKRPVFSDLNSLELFLGLIKMLQDSPNGLSHNSITCASLHIKTNSAVIAE